MWGDSFYITIALLVTAMVLPTLGLWLLPRYFHADVEADRIEFKNDDEPSGSPRSLVQQLEISNPDARPYIFSAQYDEELQIESQDSEWLCVICMGELETGSCVRRLPCEHVFHCSCIDSWLDGHPDCPVCRKQVLDTFLVTSPKRWRRFASQSMIFGE
eukprot:symbB.v1.2.004320.t1/scaffold188.1/size279614/9